MFRTLSVSSIALIVAASPVFAEVTPAQVWENITSYYEQFGYELTEGSRDEAGETLTVTDVTMTMGGMPDGGSFSMMVPKVVLQQTGDGNVRTVFEGDITGTVTPIEAATDAAATADDAAADDTATDDMTADDMTSDEATDAPSQLESIDLTMSMPGNEMVSSGTSEEMTHQMTYPNVAVTMTLTENTGMTVPVNFTATDMTGTYSTNGDATTYDMAAATLGMMVDVSKAQSGDTESGTGKVNFTMSGLGMKGEAVIPEGQTNLGENMNAALTAGANMSATFTYDSIDGTFDFANNDAEGGGQTGSGTVKAGAGDLAFMLSKEMLAYSGSSKDLAVEMQASDLPAQIGYNVGSSTFALELPVTKSDAAQPFKLATSITDLTLPDSVWSLFDAQSKLPHEPASMNIDVAGDLTVTRDLFDQEYTRQMVAATTVEEGQTELTPEQIATISDLQAEAMPFTAQKLSINDISLDLVGASAKLNGELTVPEGGSVQEPVGTITGNFTGISTLMDTMAAMGFVPQEQVGGMKMMMMAFAKPVEGKPDTLTTELEFREGGQVFANGQQVK